LIISKSATLTLKEELTLAVEKVRALAETTYQNTDLGAAISSGSFRTRGMIIAPCSIRTLSDIAYGTTDSLLSRAADVTLKERRRLVLVVREAPLHAGHLRSMLAVTESGGIIVPPVPAFYHRQKKLTISSIRLSDGASICSTSTSVWSNGGGPRTGPRTARGRNAIAAVAVLAWGLPG
jgi:4-hydroxy-3-polyprenylbenzoate decarboxylase